MRYNLWKHGMVIGLVIILLAISSIAKVARAQPVKKVTINYIEASADPKQFGNRVSAYVTVSSADQNPILGLEASNFQILEDGRQIALEDVSRTTEPMAVVLAIDTSGSMQARDRSGKTSMEAAKSAAIDFISMLGGDDQVALYSFNNEAILHLDFSIDHEAAINAVKALSAKYQAATLLYDTALEAVKKAAEIPKGRRAVILLTDGKDEKGKKPYSIHGSNDIIDAATTKTIRVPIYTVGVGPQVDAKELGRIASLTGGRSLLAISLTELSGFYKTIANQLKNQYAVRYITRVPSGEHSLIIKIRHEDTGEQDEKRFWSPPLPVIQPPAISIVSPRSTDKIQGLVNVRVSIKPEEGVSKVRYYVDASLKEEDSHPPFEDFKWETTNLTAGLHILRVEAVHISGQTGSAETTIKITAPTSALTLTPPATAGKEEEKKGGIPLVAWIAVLLFLAVIAGGGFWWRCQRKPEEVEYTGVSTETRVRDPSERLDWVEKRIETPSSIDTEATTIDVQESLEPIAKLTVLKSQGLDLGATFKVLGTTKLGRSSENHVSIPDKPVSRKHAEILYTGGKFYIRDLKSSYGTKVDGKEVTPAGITLYDGAHIQLGTKTVLEFNILVFKKDDDDDDKTMIYDQGT